jgi:hypothetical protein
VTCEALKGDPREGLCSYEADLLVLGARGHGRTAALLLGSVASYLARRARVPVVIVPCPAGGETKHSAHAHVNQRAGAVTAGG